MNVQQRYERMRVLVAEMAHHLDVLADEGEAGILRRPEEPEREKVEPWTELTSNQSVCLDFGGASDAVIGQFMNLVTPVAVPTELGAARALFEQLAAEAECIGRREKGGYLWGIRLGDNGRYELWVGPQGGIERVDYRPLRDF